MAAAETTRGPIPYSHSWDQNVQTESPLYKANVSQSEYFYKHRLLFEGMRRSEISRKRRSGEPLKDVQYNRVHSYKPIGHSWSSQNGGLSGIFTFSVNIPNENNSISNIESAQLNLQIIPNDCTKGETDITLHIFEEEKKVHVDACRPRWESLSIQPLPSHFRSLHITCADCTEKGVKFSEPYLNVFSKTVKKTRFPRQIGKKTRRKCQLTPLVINLSELPSFKHIVSPTKVDIGRCRGSCIANFKPQSQHAFFRYDMAAMGKGPKPCCAPFKFKPLEYLILGGPNKNRLVRYHWDDAIAIDCSCN